MTNLKTLPQEMVREILMQIPSPLRTSSIKALCLTSKSLRETYQAILFEHVSAKTPKQFCALTFALVSNQPLANLVTKANMNVSDNFEDWTAKLDPKVEVAANKMKFSSKKWGMDLKENNPHALCGLLLALLPNIITLSITTRKMIRKDVGFLKGKQRRSWHYKDRSWSYKTPQSMEEAMISTKDLFGIASEAFPETLPRLEYLQHWTSDGMMPAFSFSFPALTFVDFSFGLWIHPAWFSLSDFLPKTAPTFGSVEGITIRTNPRIFRGASECYDEPFLRKILQSFINIKQIKIVMQSVDGFFLENNEYLRFDMLFNRLTGPATSLAVELDQFTFDERYNVRQATILPELSLTKTLELPEVAILGGQYARNNILESSDGDSVFLMHTLVITNATRRVKKIMRTLLQHRQSRFYILKELHISYFMGSELLEEDGNETENANENQNRGESDKTNEAGGAGEDHVESGAGETENDSNGGIDSDAEYSEDEDEEEDWVVHRNLCKLLEDEGVKVARCYGSYPQWG